MSVTHDLRRSREAAVAARGGALVRGGLEIERKRQCFGSGAALLLLGGGRGLRSTPEPRMMRA